MNFSFSKESLIEVGRKHWKEFQPTRFKSLTKAGTLNEELEAAVNMTLKAMADDMAAGFQQHEAWEMEREHHLILREEPRRRRKQEHPHDPAFSIMCQNQDEMARIRQERDDREDSVTVSGNDLLRSTMTQDNGDPPPDVAAFIQSNVDDKSLVGVARWMADHARPADRSTARKALDGLRALERCCVTLSFRVAHVLNNVPPELFSARSITAYTFGKAISCLEVWVNGADVTGKVGVSYEVILQELVRAAALGGRDTSGVLRGEEVVLDPVQHQTERFEIIGGRDLVEQQATDGYMIT